MNIDANTPERDEFDGDPLNPKHIEAVCGYLKNSPRDNLKKQALEIIEAQQNVIEGQSTEIIQLNEVIRQTREEVDLLVEFVQKRDVIIDRQSNLINRYDEAITLLDNQLKEKSFISRIVLWFKGK